jgi:hypothetical protein
MIRDEIDIIEPLLCHLDALFNKVYLLDHKSVDGTTEYLKQAVAQRSEWVYIALEFNGTFQKHVSNILLKRAFADGADFVFYLDADEFIWVKDRQELEASVQRLQDCDSVGYLSWRNCLPFRLNEGNFSFDTRIWLHDRSSIYKKVIISRTLFERLNGNIVVLEGNHIAISSDNDKLEPIDLGLLIHIPIRSKKQAEKKLSSQPSLIKLWKIGGQKLGFIIRSW